MNLGEVEKGKRVPGPRGSTRRAAAISAVITTAVLVTAAAVALNQPKARRWIATVDAPAPPTNDVLSLRKIVARQRDGTVDLSEQAIANALLSHEALLRARATHVAWLGRAYPATHLYAKHPSGDEWNYRDTAGDFFAFHLHAGLRLNPSALPSLRKTLASEASYRSPEGLCQPTDAATGKPISADFDELMFASSEYVKDGLLSVVERHGPALVGPRAVEVTDAILRNARHRSKFGNVPGTGAEVNGNLLQICSRFSFTFGREDYAEFAGTIADALVLQSLRANNGLPPKFFDYEADRVIDASVKLKDHGNEAVFGLAEAYALATHRSADPKWAARAQAWASPLAEMFEKILKHGVTADGLLVTGMNAQTLKPTSNQLCDNWGYLLSGALLFTEAARRHGVLPAERLDAIDAGVDAIAGTVFSGKPAEMFGGDMDSEADAIESALYIAFHRPPLRERALRWADDRIQLMFLKQRPDGTAGSHYLDGNFIRTSLMYSDARAGGWRVDPFREDVLVGAATDERGNQRVVVRTTDPYTGVLKPDFPRHRAVMKLPWNWPRLNSWPEWSGDLSTATVTGASGVQLTSLPSDPVQGVALDLPANGSVELSLTFPVIASDGESNDAATRRSAADSHK